MNEATALERLRLLGESDDDVWIESTLEREQWIGQVLQCLNRGGEVDHESSPGTSPLGLLLAAVATATVALGAQAGWRSAPSAHETISNPASENCWNGPFVTRRPELERWRGSMRSLLSSIEGGAS